MKQYIVFALVAAVFAAAVIAAGGIATGRVVNAHSGEPAAEAQGDTDAGRSLPDDWFLSQRLSGDAPSQATLQLASAQAGRLAQRALTMAPATVNARWSYVGPDVIGGRIVDLAIDPTASDTVYVAAASGGIWKTTDAGVTFQAAWPNGNGQAFGALAISPTGKLYAGAGEANPGGGSISFGGKGVYLSGDGGKTWKSLGLGTSERIARIAIDPTNEQRIFVAAAGPLFKSGGARGIYLTTDGGQSWNRVLQGANTTTGASDVQIDPANPKRIFAVLWDHLRVPDQRRYGGSGSGIYRSTDGGTTWTRLAGGLPAPAPDVGRIGLGQSPSTPNRLYAVYINAAGIFTGFYTSTDGGDAWTLLPKKTVLANSQSSYGWWFGRIWVDPASSTHVFVAGVPLMESTDGGQTWIARSGVHSDQHAMAWDPRHAGRVYLGNDGGFYRSNANGAGGWVLAQVQPFTQFYSVDVGEQHPSRIVGGAQDNFCNRSYTSSNPNQWNAYGSCGDGLGALINPANEAIVYSCSQYGDCTRSTDGGDSSASIGATTSVRRNWRTPLVFDPSNPDVMYYAGNIVNRSTNGGVSWTAISTDLTGNPPQKDAYPWGTVTTVAASKTAPNTILAGTDDGKVWYTRNGGGSWTQAIDPALPARWVTRIAIDPADWRIAYVTFSGFRNGESTPYVLRTGDGGVTWKDISGNLPQAPLNDVGLTDGGATVVVAGDLGIYLTKDAGVTWAPVGTGLPRVPVMDFRIHEPTRTIYAATFGRGMWKVQLPP